MSDTRSPDAVWDALAEAYLERLRSGEQPDVEEYARAHPAFSARIRELFPVLCTMERLKARAAPTAAAIPERLDGYEVLGELGRGGMAVVYNARDSEGREVALKVVHPHLVRDRRYVDRFLREVQVGLRVRHPNIVATLATGRAQLNDVEVPYVVLERVGGKNLHAMLEEAGTLPERLCSHVGVEVARALEALHRANVVHRDVKPANVIITSEEHVKLADMGVAFLQDEALRLSRSGEFVGTLLYAAPEQLRGGTLDGRADLYALGMLLHEMACGYVPPGLVGHEKPPPDALASAVSPFLRTLIEALLEPDPEDRPGSAADVVEALALRRQSRWWTSRAPAPLRLIRRGASLPRRRAPLLGREAELSRLASAYDAVRAGDGRVVLLVGEAGIGKTRVVDEWLEDFKQEDGPAVLLVENPPGGAEIGAAPVAAALREHFGVGELQRRIPHLLGDERALAPLLLAELRGDTAVPVPRARPEVVARGWLRLLLALADDRPLIVVIEDLHFAAQEARATFLALAHAVADHPLLLMGTTRAGAGALWLRALDRPAHVERIELAGLDEEHAGRLFRRVYRGDARGAPWRRVARSTQGNPFCIEAFAQEWDPDEARERAGTFAVPATVQVLVADRLRGLSPQDRDLLGVAACAGARFDPVLVARAGGLPRLETLRRLHRLERDRHLLVAQGTAYRFAHHLVHEALYASLPPALRQAYHVALGEALKADTGDRGADASAERAAVLCSHFLAAGRIDLAQPHLEVGLRHIARHGDTVEAGRQAARALELEGALPTALAARLHLHAGRAVMTTGGLDAALAHVDESVRLAELAGDVALLGEARAARATCLRRLGRLEEAEEIGRLALETSAEPATALADLALTQARRHRLDEAEASLARLQALLKSSDDPSAHGDLLYATGYVQMMRSDHVGARETLTRLVALSEEHQLTALLGQAFGLCSTVEYLLGDTTRAAQNLERSIAAGVQAGDVHGEGIARVNRAVLLSVVGRLDEAVGECDEGLAALGDHDAPQLMGHLSLTRCIARLRQGRYADVEDELDRIVRYGEVAQEALLQMDTWLARVRLYAWTARYEDAMRAQEEADHLAQGAVRADGRLRNAMSRFHLLRHAGDVKAACDCADVLVAEHASRRDGRMGCAVVLIEARRAQLFGDEEAAGALFLEAAAMARRAGQPTAELHARALAVGAGHGDADAVREALRSAAPPLPLLETAEAWQALWRRGRCDEDRERALAARRMMLEGARPEHRKALERAHDRLLPLD